jgi:hypothetical protein
MSYSWGVGLALARTEVLPLVRQAVRPDPQPRGSDLRLLAAELAPMVEVWQRLLAQHIPDRAGRCRTCTEGGTGLPSLSWPCSIHGIADLARRCHAGEAC